MRYEIPFLSGIPIPHFSNAKWKNWTKNPFYVT